MKITFGQCFSTKFLYFNVGYGSLEVLINLRGPLEVLRVFRGSKGLKRSQGFLKVPRVSTGPKGLGSNV